MKVLIVYSDLKCSCTRKGTFELSKGLNTFTPTHILYYTDLKEKHFKEYDVILFQRLGGNGGAISETYFKFLENQVKVYKNKTYTAYLLDDLLLNEKTKRMMKLVDKLIVPNPNYLKHVEIYNTNVFYIRTFVDLEEIVKIKSKLLPKKNINLLWASTGGVGSSFMEKLVPVLEKKMPEAVVHILGTSGHIFKKFGNTRVYPILPYEEFIKYFKSCDIYLNPITIDVDYFRNVKTTDFISCKSEIKYATAGAVKKPIISSRSLPYEYAIKDSINGVLLDNVVEDWIYKIKQLDSDSKFRNNIIKNAYDDVSKNYSVKSAAEKIYKLFKYFFEDNTAKNGANHYVPSKHNIGNDQSESNSIVGEIFGNKKIFQSFTSKGNNLYKIDLRFATYARKNSGVLRVSLSSSYDGAPVRSVDIPCDKIYDNRWHVISFDPIPESSGKIYYLKIEGVNCRVGSSITAYYSTNRKITGDFYINKTKFNGTLSFKTYFFGD